METVLYELSYKFPTLVIVFFILASVFFIFFYLNYRSDCKKGYGSFRLFWITEPTIEQEKRFMLGYWIVVPALCLVFIFFHWNWYDSLKDKYEAGNYEEVYGYVEDFKAGVKYGRGREADDIFTVGGIEFIINPGDMFYGDYVKIHNNEGVITGDGQYLHIKYINRYVGNVIERYIVYIAEIEEKGNQ